MNYACHLLVLLSIYSILAISLNLVVGYAGLLTFAHAAYFALGCYVYAVLALRGMGFIPAAGFALILGGICSLAVSLPAWRLRGDFFVLASLAVQVVILDAIRNWANPSAPLGTLLNLTNGPLGIAGIPKPIFIGHTFDTTSSFATLAVVLAVGAGLVCWRLTASPWGRLLKCMRDDELATRSLGKNVRLAKLQVFAFSCALAAVAGALYAGYVNYIDPSTGSLDESILMLSMVLIGGTGNFRGPLVGAVILVAIPELLRFFHIANGPTANLRILIYGLLLITFTHLRPQGIAGDYRVR